MTSLITLPSPVPALLRDIATHAVAGLDSAHTRRQYARDIELFLTWCAAHPRHSGQMSRAAITDYKAHLRDTLKQNPPSVNRAMSALRKFTHEAAERGMLDHGAAQSIIGVKGVKTGGSRTGRWLTPDQLRALIAAPDISTVRGLRDRALLCVLGGAGLRRGEASGVRRTQMQERDGRPALVDVLGKRRKIRTVPLFAWAHRALLAWTVSEDCPSDYLFCQMNKYDEVAVQTGKAGAGAGRSVDRRTDARMSEEGVRRVVQRYADQIDLGFALNAHDLRRTFAKLLRAQGAPIEQISTYLGHDSIDTTKRYLGTDLDYDIEKWSIEMEIL